MSAGSASLMLVVAADELFGAGIASVLDAGGAPPWRLSSSEQLRAHLAHAPEPSLVVLAIDADPADALACAEWLRRRYPRLPLLAVLSRLELEPALRLPPGPTDWLHRDRFEAEWLLRWQRLRASEAGHASRDAERALSMLARISGNGAHGQDLQVVANWLADGLQLDYVSIWSRLDGQSVVKLLRVWRGGGAEPHWPAPEQRGLLAQVLDGRALLYADNVHEHAAADDLPALAGLVGFAGWPIRDDRQHVFGALLVGARRPLSAQILPVLLGYVADRFGHQLDLQREREAARAKGLLDPHTGLPNRLLFHDRLETTIREARRTGESFAVLTVDIDHFQKLNDSYGREVGDQALRETARRLLETVRTSDSVARYLGDQFTLILRHIARRDDALRIADKVVQAIALPLNLPAGGELALSASVGVSFFPTDAVDAETLLKHSGEALRGAKALGRNHAQFYAPGVELSREQSQSLKARLRHAEENGELRVYYQPQVDTFSEDIVGMEALLRWEHPQLGSIGPAQFVPLAEETGLIVSIGEWLLRHACEQAQAWQRRYGLGLRMGVNLSVVQLTHPRLSAMLDSALRDSGLAPELLELEITESLSMKSVPNLIERLQALQALGCSVAIDDFGTGAASLDYLRRLPSNRIKLDQSFVRNIGIDPDDEAIVRTTIEMAHRLHRTVIAEGVEIEPHLRFLRDHGCDELQGYLFCRPLPHAAFEQLLAERERVLAEASRAQPD